MLEIHKGVGGPELLVQFLARDDLAGMREQHRQDLKGLFLDFDLQAVLAQLGGAKVNLEGPEVNDVGDESRVRHGPPPGVGRSLPPQNLKSKHLSTEDVPL